MKKIFIITAALLLLSLNFYSQTGTKPAGNTYDQLLAKLKAGDTGIDYKALRMSYTETKDYSTYGVDPDERSSYLKLTATMLRTPCPAEVF